MKAKTLSLTLCLVLGLVDATCRAEESRDSLGLVHSLQEAKSAKEMDSLVNSIVQRQQELFSSLSGILRSSAPGEVKARACYLLGELRADQEVGWMIANLDLRVDNTQYDGIPLWRRYPCQEALAAIGRPAERRLIRLLITTDKEDIQDLVIKTLVSIEMGTDGARLLLQKAIIESPKEDAIKLEKFLGKLKK